MPSSPAIRHLLSIVLFFVASARADVVITEFLASNQNGITDENGETSDWIELYNNGTTVVDLSGWRLTDEEGVLDKWVFPATTLEPKGFLIVFASSKDR